MHLKIRVSSLKRRKRTGFRRKMRTKGGRAILSRKRRRESGKGKKRGYKKTP
ncbi:MAG: 50S ribosomal protein L34 [Planctomycetes bacterium]|nr:50S ribosomal protein L34 [Planctomycetota bacterium]